MPLTVLPGDNAETVILKRMAQKLVRIKPRGRRLKVLRVLSREFAATNILAIRCSPEAHRAREVQALWTRMLPELLDPPRIQTPSPRV